MHFDRFCITLTKVRLTNPQVAINPYNSHFIKAKKHNLFQHLIFSGLYVVVLIKSTERHFKESNTCLSHISHRCREVRKYSR